MTKKPFQIEMLHYMHPLPHLLFVKLISYFMIFNKTSMLCNVKQFMQFYLLQRVKTLFMLIKIYL